MIVFGTRGRVIAGAQIQDMECPNCGNNSFLTFGVLRYFHIFWIPVFPTSRLPGLECLNCKNARIGDEIRDPVRSRIKAALFTTKRTAPMFVGLAFIAMFVAFVAITESKNAEQERLYLANPEIGDLYVVRVSKIFDGGDPDYDYVLMQVESVNGDQIGFKTATMQYNIPDGPSDDIDSGKALDPGYYAEAVHMFAVDELRAIRDDGGIHSIERR